MTVTLQNDRPEKRKAHVVDANAVSPVHGKIRSFIEDLTIQRPIRRQIMPAIEPYALLRSLEERREEEHADVPVE
ncbi:MAG: hypothetical protein Q4A07_02145 [Coriobacteriales bacterium]|nr:hypothetical protein [Coriobacteriales bacterium]